MRELRRSEAGRISNLQTVQAGVGGEMRIIDITLGDKGTIQNVDWVAWIMNEIEGEGFTRKDVARTYSYLLQTETPHDQFAEINRAIIKRWSPSALRWIKEQAWKIAKSEQREKAAYTKYGGCTCMGHGECNFCKER